MQSARTKQLLILGHRKNRTNDLLRELSARRECDPQLLLRRENLSGERDSSGGRRWKRTRERLKSVTAKVDTGLHRKRFTPSAPREALLPRVVVEPAAPASPEHSFEGARGETESSTSTSDNGDISAFADDGDDLELPPRTRVRSKCARDAREALEVLRSRPLSPRSVEKFRGALELMRAQRALIEAELLRANASNRLDESANGAGIDDEGSESEVDAVEDYDPTEQISEEFGSVFGAVAHESRDLLKREAGGTNMKEVEKHLLEHYPAIRNIFKYYSSMTKPFDENITAAELGSMTLSDWMTFVKDCKLIGPHPRHQLVKSSAELLFIRLNWVTDDRGRKVKNRDLSNSDRTLIMPEFICGILRLAKQCGVRMDNFGLTASRFIKDIVYPRAHSVDVEEFRTRMRFRSARAALDAFQADIRSVFVRYAAAEAKSAIGGGLETMDLKELMQLCRNIDIVTFNDADHHLLSPLAVQHAFALSQLQVVGDDAGEIDADEFIELIARLAENFFDVYFTAIANAESARLHRVSHPGENVLALAPAPRVDDVALAPKLRWFLPRLAAASSSRSVPVH